MDDSPMLATIRDDTWNVLNMQHISHHAKKQPTEAERLILVKKLTQV